MEEEREASIEIFGHLGFITKYAREKKKTSFKVDSFVKERIDFKDLLGDIWPIHL